MAKVFTNSEDPDQMQCSAASDGSALFANYPFRVSTDSNGLVPKNDHLTPNFGK